MKITTPDTLALTMRLEDDGVDARLHFAFLCGFGFDPRAPLFTEAALWSLARQAGGDAALDAGYPKPGAEVLVFGRAQAPTGLAADALAPRVRIGSLVAPLFTPGAAGRDIRRDADTRTTMPPPGRARWGTFNLAWASDRWPLAPCDLDPRARFTAPDVQCQGQPFRGDEAIEIHHMHCRQAVQRARLPGVRARCWVRRLEPGARWESIPSVADTLWLFPAFSAGILLHRACVTGVTANPLDRMVATWAPLTPSSPKPPRSSTQGVDHATTLHQRQCPRIAPVAGLRGGASRS